ncbi:serine/threonine protein kinase [Labilithrix luteola]|uniref:Serine/threonine protein kinase n=1 Tax=Labilithrix luteola TaxID=1391654 RepID=A0A0K1PUV9_9BACT|nr:serine/threonine-protein kinase [Labilithrix luteola]AKU97307.1 serine/threonine protein kinase [Labilithrix luteola]
MGPTTQDVRVVGRYALYGAIAAGGMATVHLGRLMGPVGFSRTVAIKRLHAQFASDPEFVSMFLDEARLAARIRHPNVVPTLDVVATGGELFLVMEYVPGESLSRLARVLREQQQTVPLRILSGIMAGVLHGLHSAHEAKDERGEPLGIVHRDVSPQNVLVGTDGVAKILDFGVAKAAGRMQTTREGQIKGKLAYMPPEQLRGAVVTRQTDIYAAGVMLWELVTGQRLFTGDNEGVVVARVLEGKIEAPSKVLNAKPTPPKPGSRSVESLDSVILRALAMKPEDRFQSAREMALELERRCPPATASEIGDWVESVAKDVLTSRAALIAEIESSASISIAPENHVLSVLSAPGPESLPRLESGSPMTGAMPPGVMPTAASISAMMAAQGLGSAPGYTSSADAMRAQAASMPSTSGIVPVDSFGHGVPRTSSPLFIDGPPVTQPSSISVATGTHGAVVAPPKSGGKRLVLVAFALIVLTAGAFGTSVVYKRTLAREAAPVDPHPTAVVSATPGPDMTGVATSTSASSEKPSGTSASATAASNNHVTDRNGPPSTKSSGGTKPRQNGGAGGGTKAAPSASATPTIPPPPPPPPAEDCSNPTWYDAQGVKHYKEQCLQK